MDPYRYIYIISSLLLLIGAASGMAESLVMDMVYLSGALGFGVYYLLAPTRRMSLRMRRLVRMNIFASLLFTLSAIVRMGWFERVGRQLWIVALLMGLIFMIYASVIPMLGRDRENEIN